MDLDENFKMASKLYLKNHIFTQLDVIKASNYRFWRSRIQIYAI